MTQPTAPAQQKLNTAQAIQAIDSLDDLTQNQARQLTQLASLIDQNEAQVILYADAFSALYGEIGDEERKKKVDLFGQLLKAFNKAAKTMGSNYSIERKQGHSFWFEGPQQFSMASTPQLDRLTESDNIYDVAGEQPNGPWILLLSVNDHETRAIKHQFNRESKTFELKNQYLLDDLGIYGKHRVYHFKTQMASSSMGGSQQALNSILNNLPEAWDKPSCIMGVGIAFGVDNCDIGTPLVSNMLIPFELSRVSEGEIIMRDGRSAASSTWISRAANLKGNQPEGCPFDIKIGALLSGGKLIDDINYRDGLIKSATTDQIIGGEMEGQGICVACEPNKIDWLLVKSVCDWADGNKNHPEKEKRQLFAAVTAAQTALAIIQGDWDGIDLPDIKGKLKKIDRIKSSSSGCIANTRDLEQIEHAYDLSAKKPDPNLFKLGERKHNNETEKTPAKDLILEWLDKKPNPLFVVLAEYGMGKTVLCQMIYRDAVERYKTGVEKRMPYYFDLRGLTDAKKGVPTLNEMIAECIARHWPNTPQSPNPKAHEVMAHINEGKAIVIFDGLDEVITHYNEADGQTFTRELLKAVPKLSQQPPVQGGTQVIISCRDHFFKTWSQQVNAFVAQERSHLDTKDFSLIELLPLSEDTVRDFLAKTLPEQDVAQMIELMRSVHNIIELSQRPYTLSMMPKFLPEIQALKDAGQPVFGVTLYRRTVLQWLERDNGKHSLFLDDKQAIAQNFAARLWRSAKNSLSITDFENWLIDWINADHRRMSKYPADKFAILFEDLRNATFLVRQNDGDNDHFKFAHTSLQEYFIAAYLFEALVNNRPADWAMPIPSPETLDFLGQLCAESQATQGKHFQHIAQWRKTYQAHTSELLLVYALAAHQQGWPSPILVGIDLQGAQLKNVIDMSNYAGSTKPVRWFDLRQAQLQGADLRQNTFAHIDMSQANLNHAQLDFSTWWHCRLNKSQLNHTRLTAVTMRHCQLTETEHEYSQWYGAQLYQCKGQIESQSSPPSLLTPPLQYPIKQSDHTEHMIRKIQFKPQSPIYCLAFSPDGQRVVSGGADKTLRLWDAHTGEAIGSPWLGHESSVISLAFSPDGQRVVSGGADKTLRLWDAHTGEAIGSPWLGHESSVISLAFSPDGQRVVSGGDDDTLRLWDAHTGEAIGSPWLGNESTVWSLAFSPDGQRVVSGGDDRTLRLWDAHTGEAIGRPWLGHESSVWSLAFSPDGQRVVSGGADRTLRLWDAHTGEAIGSPWLGHESSVRSLAFSPDGQRVVSGGFDKTLRLWDAHTGEAIGRPWLGHESSVRSLAFSPDGQRVVSGGFDKTLRLWDAHTGEAIGRPWLGHESSVWSLAFSPDGQRVVSGGADKTLRLWDAHTGEAIGSPWLGHASTVWSLAFSPDGQRVVSGGADKTLRLWDAHTGEAIGSPWLGHESTVWSLAFSPDGQRVVSGGADKTLRLWDAHTGEAIGSPWLGHESTVWSLAFSPDGQRVVSGGDDKTLRLWDAHTGEAIGSPWLGHESSVWSLAFSPDGQRVVSGGNDNTLRLWDAHTGEAIGSPWLGHESTVRGLAFSPDGQRVVSGGFDNTLCLWDAHTGEAIGSPWLGHESSVISLAFSPDGQRVVSSGQGIVMLDISSLQSVWHTRFGSHGLINVCYGDQNTSDQLTVIGGAAWRWGYWLCREGDSGDTLQVPLDYFDDTNWSADFPESL